MGRRKLGAVIAFVAALLMVGGVFTRDWLTAAKGDASLRVGMLGVEACSGSQCETESWMDNRSGGQRTLVKGIAYGGYIAVAGTVVLALLLIVFAGAALRRPDGNPGVGATLTAIGAVLALIGAVVSMVLMKKYLREEVFGYGYSAFLYLGGSVLAIVGALLLRTKSR